MSGKRKHKRDHLIEERLIQILMVEYGFNRDVSTDIVRVILGAIVCFLMEEGRIYLPILGYLNLFASKNKIGGISQYKWGRSTRISITKRVGVETSQTFRGMVVKFYDFIGKVFSK